MSSLGNQIGDTHQSSAPMFIIGAGRSGTTLLYRALCMHPDTAWISNYLAHQPNLSWLTKLNRISHMVPALPRLTWFGHSARTSAKRKNPLMRVLPMPVEGESVYEKCDIPRFPAADWRISDSEIACLKKEFETIKKHQNAEVFISKRTANNRRISQLYKAFPNARFVHIVRDGRAVASSLIRTPWWNDHQVWWWDERPAKEWENEGRQPLEMGAINWLEEMKVIETGLQEVPKSKVLEIRYEDLVSDPIALMTQVGECFGLGVDKWRGIVSSLQITDQNIGWRSRLNDGEKNMIWAIQKDTLEKYSYSQ